MQEQEVFAVRAVDGDTIEIEDGLKIRLKGINAPEKSMIYYDEAREFLSGLVADKRIRIENYGADRYGRLLVYAYAGGVLINKEILRRGFGNLYYYEKDEHFKELEEAEKFARLNKLGIWKASPDEDCIKLIELKTDEPEKLVLENNCGREIEVLIKDDATHVYQEILGVGLWEKSFSHIWNTDGDTLYVWDGKGLLVFYRY